MVDRIPNGPSHRRLRRAVVRPVKLAHVVVRTSRFRETCRWYLTVLSAEVAFETEEVAFLRYDDEHHRIGILNVPVATDPDRNASGVEHVSFTFDRLKDL